MIGFESEATFSPLSPSSISPSPNQPLNQSSNSSSNQSSNQSVDRSLDCTNCAVGIDFTDWVIRDLTARGFRFVAGAERAGYQPYTCYFQPGPDGIAAFEIRVVSDESEYLRSVGPEQLRPFLRQVRGDEVRGVVVPQPNSIERLVGRVNSLRLPDPELRDYLALRKDAGIPALHLNCRDFAYFTQRAKPDRRFKGAALIHLGPSCFDLVITANDA